MKLRLLLGTALLALPAISFAQTVPAPLTGVKNIIIVINDGGGPTVYDATRLYLGKPLVTDGAGFQKTYVSTFPLRADAGNYPSTDPRANNNKPGSKDQSAETVYDSAKFWDTTPVDGNSTIGGYTAYPAGFAGYEFSRFAHPDSGNTASALASAVKTYNNAINVDGAGDAQLTITDLIDAARNAGQRTGVVTSVQFGDATPAALGGAHNIARANRTAIAQEMFSAGKLDVIAGTGNPDYDDDGLARTPAYTWINADLWSDLKTGGNTSGLNQVKWSLYQNKEDIEALAAGTIAPPTKLAMIIKGDNSSQFNRTNGDGSTDPSVPHTSQPYDDARKTNVPALGTMAVAALEALGGSKSPVAGGKGFYLMVEAGAVDRAEHANNEGRMIEEQLESNDTVQSIIDWVNRKDTKATWANTILIVTADHDHLLYGPDGATVPFQALVDGGVDANGKHLMPAAKFFGPNHGTGLVPMFVYGKHAAELTALATNNDSYTDANGNTFGHGAYVDQTVLGATLKATVMKKTK